MTNASGTVTRVYDEQNRVISKTVSGAGASTYLYDVTTGMPANCTGEVTTDAEGNAATRVYDKAGRLYQIISGSDVTTYTYMDNGSLELLTYPNGLMAQYTYYDNNKLHTLANKSGNTILSAYNYAYDAAGNLVTELDIDGTTTYTYDELNRLESVMEPDGKLTEYTYDAAGNRETETVTDGSDVTTTSYTYDEDLNRLAGTEKTLPGGALETTLYDYDGNGALIARHAETLANAEAGDMPGVGVALTGSGGDGYALYAYDVWGQLTSAETPDSVSAYTYNGEGLRVSKSVTEDSETTETAYLYEYSKVVLELDENGDEAAHNVYGNNTLISRTTGDGTLYYLYNGHGDVVQLADALGAIVMTYDYDAFGVVTMGTGSISNSYLYSGYQYDGETGMYYLNARYYDPVVARFVSADSYLGEVNDPLSLNVYTYCRNNPLIYWDPTGHVVTQYDLDHCTDKQIEKIIKATDDWNKANAAGDKDAMVKAHNDANDARKEGKGNGRSGYNSDDSGRPIDENKNSIETTDVYLDRSDFRDLQEAQGKKSSNLVDPADLVPTVLQAALMSAHIYDYDMSNPQHYIVRDNDGREIGWELVDVKYGHQGMKMGVYAKKDGTGKILAYTLAFKGTTTVDDWINDVEAYMTSIAPDMEEAVAGSRDFVALHSKEKIKITFVGHSKGGGEAIAAAIENDMDAITFNAANFAFKFYVGKGKIEGRTSSIQNFYIEGEWLSSSIKVARIGDPIMLPTQYWEAREDYTGRGSDTGKIKFVPDALKNHDRQVVIEALKKEGYR